MSSQSYNLTSLLHKYLVVQFEGVDEIVYVTKVCDKNDILYGKINPGSDFETYCELYKDDNPESWYIVETFG